MEVIEEIKNLDLSQKMLLMEKLWDELSEDTSYATPSWHLETLQSREEKEDFISVDEAKQRIEKLLK